MQTAPFYTWRNRLTACLLTIELFCFVAPIVFLPIEDHLRSQEPHAGWEGEGAGLAVVLLFPLALYTLPFWASALQVALKKGSRPMSGWLVLLGLLPLIGLLLLIGTAQVS